MMPICDPWDDFFCPTLILMMDSYKTTDRYHSVYMETQVSLEGIALYVGRLKCYKKLSQDMKRDYGALEDI